MKRMILGALLALAAALSACHTMPGTGRNHGGQPQAASGESGAPPPSASSEPQPESRPQGTANPEEPSNDMSPSADANAAAVPPCLPSGDKAAKVKPKPKLVRKPPPPPPPQVAETPPANGIVDARVAPLPVPVMSILGKKVQSPTGDDLGRVVDVLADSGGRVRVAIIDFGGFLGVGNRRIAVDWPLLRFNPDRRDPSLLLSLSREKLQAAPEYKDNPQPQTLMFPEPAAAAPAAGPPADAAPPANDRK